MQCQCSQLVMVAETETCSPAHSKLPICSWYTEAKEQGQEFSSPLHPLSYMVSPMQELCKEAADYGLIYGLEVVNRYETNILNTAAQVAAPAYVAAKMHSKTAWQALLAWQAVILQASQAFFKAVIGLC